ncbi:MAG TPA: hypothetical protein VME22_29590 [Solirubrobacteraceae bacterium]|nr:hypothetical protein [Solirubrobacteraceae bacterium]
MSSIADRNPVELDTMTCEACGKSYEATPHSEVYSIVPDQERPHVASFQLCPSCAVTLVDEIAANVPIRYLDGLAATVNRRVGRRAEREAVAS